MNASNKSSPTSSEGDVPRAVVFALVSYLIEGLVVGGTNFFIAFLVLRFEALRRSKEFLVIFSLSVADGCNMFGYAMAGARRLHLAFSGKLNTMMAPWECLFVSHNIVWSFSMLLSGLVLLVVSIDRLLAVAIPLRYLTWSTKYVMILFGSAYIYTIITGTIMSLMFHYIARDELKSRNVVQTALCYTGDYSIYGINYYYSKYRAYGYIGFALASILVYGLVWVLYTRHENRVTDEQLSSQKKQSLKRQRQLTLNLGISCLCTVFVYTFPIGLAYLLPYGDYTLFFWLTSNLNPMCNALIYYHRQPQMKQALIALFTGKTMPDTLEAWERNSRAKRTATKNQEQNKVM